jgi:hypothetical protein
MLPAVATPPNSGSFRFIVWYQLESCNRKRLVP